MTRDWSQVEPTPADVEWEQSLYDEADASGDYHRYWHRVPRLIATARDYRDLLALAKEHGPWPRWTENYDSEHICCQDCGYVEMSDQHAPDCFGVALAAWLDAHGGDE